MHISVKRKPGTGTPAPGRGRNGAFLVALAGVAFICTGVGFFAGVMVSESEMQQRPAGVPDASPTSSHQGVSDALPRPLSVALPRTQPAGHAPAPDTASRPSAGAGICANTCATANDGVCDDGRPPGGTGATAVNVKCDLGTDCADCGAWQPSQPPPWVQPGAIQAPIALLTSRGNEVRIRRTSEMHASHLNFSFAYTSPDKDLGVSAEMERLGLVEAQITKIFYNVFKDGCVAADGSRALFVDVGSNFGWFSIVAASMGCRVIAFEPVPHFNAFLQYNVDINNLRHLVDVRSNVVSSEAGVNMKMVVPKGGIWGTAGVGGLSVDFHDKDGFEQVGVRSVQLDQEIREDVLLMKVDVEGWEFAVFRGAQSVLPRARNIIMEYSPGVAERAQDWANLVATVEILTNLSSSGFRIAAGLEHSDPAPDLFVAPLKEYQEVSHAVLQYDLRDAQAMASKDPSTRLGCPMPAELQAHPHWQMLACPAIPEDLNPRSLHSRVPHNTNLWASRDAHLMTLSGSAGMIPVDAPDDAYFIEDFNPHHVGIVYRDCQSLDPRLQVRHRCHCRVPEVCAEEEALVTRLAKEKKLTNNFVFPVA